MDTVPIHKAKSTLSQLVKRAAAGETIYIGGYGKPEAALVCADSAEELDEARQDAKLRAQAFGCMKGKIREYDLEHIDDPLPDDVLESFYSMRGLEEWEIK